ncbi:YrzQ family protein [Bacillus sp. J33]|nr:YrzQ family protein [Bacillus sp. J33]
MLTSAMLIGAGMAAYNFAQKNNLMSGRQMRRMQKRITRALF